MVSLEHLTDKELLSFAIENGIIDVNTIQKQIEMNERRKYLEMHPYKIWEGADRKWHTYIPGEGSQRVPKRRNTKEEIEQIVIEYWKDEEFNPTVEEIFNSWNDRRLELEKISPATHLRNRQCFNRHYAEFGKKKIKHLSAEDMIDFLEEQTPKYKLTAKAFSNLKSLTKGFLKKARKQRLISFTVDDVFNELDVSETEFKKTIKEDCQEVFDENETPIIIDYLVNHLDKWNIGILLMFVTGIRVGELVALKHEVFDETSFKIRRTETKYFENGKNVYSIKEYPKSEAGVRTVVVPKDYLWLLTEIKKLNPFGEYIFVNDKGERMTTNCFRRRLERVCHYSKVYKKSPHKIRKTYGTILLDNNIDQRLAIGQMGHTNIYLTEKHYHRNRKSIDKKVEVLSSIPDFAMNL